MHRAWHAIHDSLKQAVRKLYVVEDDSVIVAHSSVDLWTIASVDGSQLGLSLVDPLDQMFALGRF